MTEQAAFFERVRKRRRVKASPAKLADKFTTLAEWYKANKPQVKSLRISGDDAWSLREYWKSNEVECRTNGFIVGDVNIQWRGFDLVGVA